MPGLMFDDLAAGQPAPDGYGGAAGVTFAGAAGAFVAASAAGAGNAVYQPAVVSPNGIAINPGGLPAEMASSNGVTFDVAYVYAATLTGSTLQLRIVGSLRGVEVANLTVELLPGAKPVLVDLNAFTGVDSVVFTHPTPPARQEPTAPTPHCSASTMQP